MDTLLLGFGRSSVLVVIEVILTTFSFPCKEELHKVLLLDGGGKELLILLSGGLPKGTSGVFLMVFSVAACVDDDTVEVCVAASDRLSCFSLTFLSSVIWFSRSQTFKNSITLD